MSRKPPAAKGRRPSRRLRDRLVAAEATLEAIRTGRVDALVVSGPQGDQTLTIDGATHPYFILLNAMSDGAALLEPGGAILFGNRSLGDIAGSPAEVLRGSMFQGLVTPTERVGFEEFLREGLRQKISGEFTLTSGTGTAVPVTVVLTTLPLRSGRATRADSRDATPVLVAVVTDLTYRKLAEGTRTRLLERLLSAEDEERRRIARELHDETGQSLTALLVGLRTIADMAVGSEVQRLAQRLRKIAAQTVDDVGRLARGLHPAALDDVGLAAATTRYLEDYVRSFGTTIQAVVEDVDSPRLLPLTAATMYRILQETLTNVVRHARAETVRVKLTRDQSALELMVSDDGVGFETGRSNDRNSGLGLRGMRERATLLGGSIQIQSTPGTGATVRVRIPAEQPSPSTRASAKARGQRRHRPIHTPRA